MQKSLTNRTVQACEGDGVQLVTLAAKVRGYVGDTRHVQRQICQRRTPVEKALINGTVQIDEGHAGQVHTLTAKEL